MCSGRVHSHFDILPGSAIRHNRSMWGSNTSAVERNRKHNGDMTAVVVQGPVWVVFGSPRVTLMSIVAGRLQDTGVHSSTLQRGNRARPDTGVESPSMDTALATLPCSEHLGDIPARWRQTETRVEATVRGKEGKLWEIGIAGVIVEKEIRFDGGPTQ